MLTGSLRFRGTDKARDLYMHFMSSELCDQGLLGCRAKQGSGRKEQSQVQLVTEQASS